MDKDFIPIPSQDIPFDGNEEEYTELILEDDSQVGEYTDFLEMDELLEEEPHSEPIKRSKGRKQLTIATCEVCGIILKHPSKIKEHMTTHTGEKPHRCEICGEGFTQKTPLNNHIRSQHLNDLPYSCSFGCGRRFVNNARKNAHELRHVGRKRQGEARPHLKPPKRLVMFKADEEVRDVVRVHEDIPSTSQDLFDSDAILADDVEIPGHISETTNQRIDEVIASVLAKTDDLTETGTSTIEPPISEVADARTKRKYKSNRRPTIGQCTICGLILKHPSKIEEHARTHSGIAPYTCGECGGSFTKPTSLRVHIQRKHVGIRPFTCKFECGKSFFTPSAKNEHEKTVHYGIKRYQCTVPGCSKMFTRRYQFMTHRKHVHREYYTDAFHVEEIVEADRTRIPRHRPLELEEQVMHLINSDSMLDTQFQQ